MDKSLLIRAGTGLVHANAAIAGRDREYNQDKRQESSDDRKRNRLLAKP
jgi:hypothetical protein